MADRRLVVFGCRKTATPVLGEEDLRSGVGLPEMEYRELPCLGALDPLAVLRELVDGTERVLGVGCFVGRCEHLSGSQRAKRALTRVGDVLEEVGVERSRVGLVLGSPIDPAGIYDAVMDFMSSDGGDDE